MMKKISRKCKLELIIVSLAFVFYFLWSITLPYNTGPDEYMRYQIPQFIYEHGTLPHGGDSSIRNEIWGISYGFTPILSYIVSAFFMKIVSLFNQSDFALLTAARLVSVIFSTGTVYMCIKIGKRFFKSYYQYLFAVFVGFLPQFVFISSYVNNDAIAIFSTSIIIYSWIVGFDTKWNVSSCIGLAIGISLCGLSYYNAYGYILCSIILFFVSLIYMNKNEGLVKYKILVQKGLLISVIVVVLIGWWFVRSYIIYGGDLLGLSTSYKYSEMYAIDQFKPSNRQTLMNQGYTIGYMLFVMGWIKTSWKSFIGVFDYMSLPIYNWMYIIFNGIVILGVVGLITKMYKYSRNIKKNTYNQSLINFGCIIASVITICISIYYSFTSDFQPQGRYCMPIILPLMYFITMGLEHLFKNIIKNKEIEIKLTYCLLVGYILISFIVYTNIIISNYYL